MIIKMGCACVSVCMVSFVSLFALSACQILLIGCISDVQCAVY